MIKNRTKIDKEKLRRTRVPDDGNGKKPDEPTPVSAGAVDKAIDLAFNPTRDKIREVTIIDRIQGRMFPQLDMINHMRHFVIEIAQFRQNPEKYRELYEKEMPESPDPLDEFLYRTAQWQKSVAGKNLEKITDIALAEKEAEAGEEEDMLHGTDPFKD